jgi:hypothetical protein
MDVPPIIPVSSGPPLLPDVPRLSAEERADLARAKALLENPGFAIRLANLLGTPIEKGFAMLPEGWARQVHKASNAAMKKGLEWSVRTLRKKPGPASKKTHQLLVGASGFVGGAFGLAALPVELPASTMLMLRSIADIARSQGHDVRSIEIRLACLEVFALGGPKKSDDAAESSYWFVRSLLAKAISEAAAFVAEKGLVEESAPAIVRLLTSLSSRFGLVVSEEVAAKSIPVLGAASGAAINVMFMRHFQDMALGHFTVKRLEAKYGSDEVRRIYGEIEPLR